MAFFQREKVHREILTTGVHRLWRPFWDRFCAGPGLTCWGEGMAGFWRLHSFVAGESWNRTDFVARSNGMLSTSSIQKIIRVFEPLRRRIVHPHHGTMPSSSCMRPHTKERHLKSWQEPGVYTKKYQKIYNQLFKLYTLSLGHETCIFKVPITYQITTYIKKTMIKIHFVWFFFDQNMIIWI